MSYSKKKRDIKRIEKRAGNDICTGNTFFNGNLEFFVTVYTACRIWYLTLFVNFVFTFSWEQLCVQRKTVIAQNSSLCKHLVCHCSLVFVLAHNFSLNRSDKCFVVLR